MLALALGLAAAIIWAAHDLLARKLSQGAELVPMILLVLAIGTLALLPLALFFGDWPAMNWRAIWLSALAGAAFAIAIGGLYKAFSMAPVRLVSPIIGAYPMISLAIAVWQGASVSRLEWLSVIAVVLGIAIVAVTVGQKADDTQPESGPAKAMIWAALSGCGFAAAFALGQAAARAGSELPAILVTRAFAFCAMASLLIFQRKGALAFGPQWKLLMLMGVMDATALGLVMAAGGLANAQYASVASALFGVLTILLAARFLKERVRPVQWVGILVVFTGIGILSAQL